MNIRSITPRPEPSSIEPALVFNVEIALSSGQHLPLDLIVRVYTEDERLLGIARPSHIGGDTFTLDAQDQADRGRREDQRQVVTALLPVTARQLEYLEEIRAKHRKRDVVLVCKVELSLLVSKTLISGLTPVEEPEKEYGSPMPVAYTPPGRVPFSTAVTNMWVLSGNGSKTFLERETQRELLKITIGSGDWVHDYLGPWGTTRYVVVELPQPEIPTSTADVAQHITAAIDAARKATGSIARGEWTDALEDLRPVWELLRKNADIAALLERDGYTRDAIDAFQSSIQHQFTLVSKFLHRLDTTGKRLNPEMKASKEDAMVGYSLAMSLLNLVARKTARLR